MALVATVGREEELDSIRAFVDDMTRGPSALAVSGPAGIGKTVLWETAVNNARTLTAHVLTCRGVEAEASLSFAGLSELITPVFDEVAPELTGPRRRALEVALLLVDADGATPDTLAIGLALLDALRVLSALGPALIAIDDVHWLDPPSATVLQIALKRLSTEPIGVLVTARESPGLSIPIELVRCFTGEHLRSIPVGPISLPALSRLLRERLSLDLSSRDVERVHAMTDGNPFFALELGRELVLTDRQHRDLASLRVPESLRELVGGRLARLPTETGDVLLAMAGLARPTIDLLASAYGDRNGVLEALDLAAREGVVRLDDGPIRFAHPLHASICYQQAPVWKRQAIHRVLAGAVADVEERALHLARAADGPDPAVAAELDAAAETAASRGAPGVAADFAILAADLTPKDDPERARHRRFRSAQLDRIADPERAVATLEELRRTAAPGPERADVLYELSATRQFDVPTWSALCDEALAEAQGDPTRSARILLSRTHALMIKGEVEPALADARVALELAEKADARDLVASAIARITHAETYGPGAATALVERGVEIERSLDFGLEYLNSPRAALARRVMRMGELARARSLEEEVAEEARARGDELYYAQVCWGLCTVEWYDGRWEAALGRAKAAVEAGEHWRERHLACLAGRIMALVEADLGLVEEARATAERGVAIARELSDDYPEILALGVLGRIELMLGDPARAAAMLRGLPERLLGLGVVDPTPTVWADTIEALVAVGDGDSVAPLLDAWSDRASAISSPVALAMAGRCRGLLAAAHGQLSSANTEFEASLAALEGFTYPGERARTLMCQGVALRQANQRSAARESLEGAVAIFDALGGMLWAERARTELTRISGRRPASDALTDTERQVATHAAQGQSNKEIAASLHMGVSTVESHLSSIYRKLDVKRAQLAAALNEAQ